MESEFLILGLSAINVELIKNMTLAGINIKMWDNNKTEVTDLPNNFFLNKDDLGKPRTVILDKIRDMSPLVRINIENEEIFKYCGGELMEVKTSELQNEYWQTIQFTGIVIALEVIPINLACKLSKICQDKDIIFALSISIGTNFFFFINNKKVAFHDMILSEKDTFLELLNRSKDIHPHIVFIIYIIRTKFWESSEKLELLDLIEIMSNLKTKPRIDSNNEIIDLVQNLSKSWNLSISPIASIAGGLLSQEIGRICTGECGQFLCCVFKMDTCEAVVASF
ncbi:ThiF family protein [Cryptosporidium muris RN66]|uniref:ThiF family protein n=1 Tax=Cryptosporidium muris (strain RN66) TaxID=441375 RepID=B6AEW1_CRYMR|nr:ThiF family protein [Cryptosporidium muris RN66]EEA06728.1 ThiF family protein [Cryptosporidium muris RN66]|eukprot:XP_002141077.1 ThiF family protein [Cryptosporidium muris RN66]